MFISVLWILVTRDIAWLEQEDVCPMRGMRVAGTALSCHVTNLIPDEDHTVVRNFFVITNH